MLRVPWCWRRRWGAQRRRSGLFRVPKALNQSRQILKRERPDVVVGVGGYASGPMVLAAALGGTATAIWFVSRAKSAESIAPDIEARAARRGGGRGRICFGSHGAGGGAGGHSDGDLVCFACQKR